MDSAWPRRTASLSTASTPVTATIGRPWTPDYPERNLLSPYDALIMSAHQSPALQRRLQRTDPSYIAQVKYETFVAMRNGESTSEDLDQRRHERARSQPNLSTPLIASAGRRSSASDLDQTGTSSAPRTSTHHGRSGSVSRLQMLTRAFEEHHIGQWNKLPRSVIENVLDQLQTFHVSSTCSTCWMRDLCAVQLTCKAFSIPAQKRLYIDVSITGPDSVLKLKSLRVQHGARLLLLRRTLRSRPTLSALVSTLHVPDPVIPLYLQNNDPNPAYDSYLCLLASLVMACPNLTVFSGFIPFYNHTFDRLTHALSTRTRLKQHVWVVAENADIALRAQTRLPPGLIDVQQYDEFLSHHSRWDHLHTLALCSPGSMGILEHDLFVHALNLLPSLKKLCISSFDADDFNDVTLLNLPKIRQLRLEECVGVSDVGLAKWAAAPNAVAIEKLILVHQNLTSLVTFAKMLAGLEALKDFAIMQTDVEPSLPMDMMPEHIIQPLLSSRSLKKLHWDIACTDWERERSRDLGSTMPERKPIRMSANTHLALSISHDGFPALTHLRAPRDIAPPGALQNVCRPSKDGNILTSGDKIAAWYAFGQTGMLGGALNPAKSTDEEIERDANSLRSARLRAQRLIDETAKERKEFVKVLITDHTYSNPLADLGRNYEVEYGEEENSSTDSRGSGLSSNTEGTDPDLEREETERRQSVIDQEHWEERLVMTYDKPDAQAEVLNEELGDTSSSAGSRPNSMYRNLRTPARLRSRAEASSLLVPTEERTGRPIMNPQYPRRLPAPFKVHEFSIPKFVGTASVTITPEVPNAYPRSSVYTFQSLAKPQAMAAVCRPPNFHLVSDIPGRDANGGIVGWGEVLRIGEKSRTFQTGDKKTADGPVDDDDDIDTWASREVCNGAWNRGAVERRRMVKDKSKSKVKDKTKDKNRGMSQEWWKHTDRPREGKLTKVEDLF